MLSPLDNRYSEKIKDLNSIFGDENYYKILHELEVEYLIYFLKFKFNIDYSNDSLKWNDAFYAEIKRLENKHKHDIYSVCENIKNLIIDDSFEYKLQTYKVCNFIHFGLTSSDIKGIADTIQICNAYQLLKAELVKLSLVSIHNRFQFENIPSPTYTHGQLATPNNLGSYFSNAHSITEEIIDILDKNIKFLPIKFGGANGDFNVMKPFFDKLELQSFKNDYINIIERKVLNKNNIKLIVEKNTTQISNNVTLSCFISNLSVLCLKLIDICQNFWFLLSKEVLYLTSTTDEVGSSTMPHKNNPITLENAEGNFKIAVHLSRAIVEALTISRNHRDLSGSTIIRNVGVLFGHILLGVKNLNSTLLLLQPNQNYNIDKENPACLMEYYQILFKFIGNTEAYNECKKFSRSSQHINMSEFFFKFSDEIIELKNKGFKIISKPSEYAKIWST